MKHQTLELRGGYQYASEEALDRALGDARSKIEDDDTELDWVRSFVCRGATLRANLQLPVATDRFLAAEVLQALARCAIDGVIELRHAGRCLDWFPSQASA